jgi:hypothetical protein
MVLAAMTRKCTHAYRNDDEIATVVSAFSFHVRVQVEGRLKNTIVMITHPCRPCNRVQLANFELSEQVASSTLFSASSAYNECGEQSMMGLNSCVRNLLLIWSRAKFSQLC